jgi:hypothetical protein
VHADVTNANDGKDHWHDAVQGGYEQYMGITSEGAEVRKSPE